MQQITIAGQTFRISPKFHAGHTLTDNEANALNQVFAENIGNNFRSKIKEAVEAGAFDSEAFQAKLDELAASYEFGLRRSSGPRQSADPVESEAMKLVLGAIHEKIRKGGGKVSSYKKEDLQAKAEEILGDRHRSQKFWDLAQERVNQKQAMTSGDLDDLLGGVAPSDELAGEAEEAPKAKRGRKAA